MQPAINAQFLQRKDSPLEFGAFPCYKLTHTELPQARGVRALYSDIPLLKTCAYRIAARGGNPARFLCARLIDVDGAVGRYHFLVASLCAVALAVLDRKSVV